MVRGLPPSESATVRGLPPCKVCHRARSATMRVCHRASPATPMRVLSSQLSNSNIYRFVPSLPMSIVPERGEGSQGRLLDCSDKASDLLHDHHPASQRLYKGPQEQCHLKPDSHQVLPLGWNRYSRDRRRNDHAALRVGRPGRNFQLRCGRWGLRHRQAEISGVRASEREGKMRRQEVVIVERRTRGLYTSSRTSSCAIPDQGGCGCN
jgi:hypothetical protein